MNQWSHFLFWNFVYDCMFIAISTDGELEPLAVKQSITCGGRSALSICWWLAANPFSVKQVCHIWPWNSQLWLFYITILCIYSNNLYLLSIIYYLSLLSIIYCLLSIIYYLDFIAINCWSSALVDVTQHLYFLRLLKTWKLLILINLVIVFIYMLCENADHYWGNVSRLITRHCCRFYLFTRIWISGMQITQRKT